MTQHLNLDMFDMHIPVFTSDKKRVRYMERKGCIPEPIQAKFRGAVPIDYDSDGTPMLSMILPKDAKISTWAHECTHVADLVMDYLGIPTGVKNTEVRAYIVSHLMDQLEKKRK